MDMNTGEIGTSVVPVMRYRNLPAAIDWLGTALGFARHHVVTRRDGAIMFAQLTLGKAMIMVGPVRESAFDKLLKQPDEVGGAETQVCYFFVADAHAHCARAKAAGAEIIFNVEDKLNGGRSYSCRDPEGHVWNFGTYNPWRRQVAVEDRQIRRRRITWGKAMRASVLMVGLSAAVLTAIFALDLVPGAARQRLLGIATGGPTSGSPEGDPTGALEQLARERDAREAAERTESHVRARRLAEAQSGKEVAERAAKLAQRQLAVARRATQAAEQATREIQERLLEAQNSRDVAEQAAKEARERLAAAWGRKGAAERTAREAKRQLAVERNARRAAELLEPSNPSPSAAAATPWRQ